MNFIPTLVLVAAIAVAAPMLAELTIRIGVPAVVLEIVLGIVFGPAVLDLAHPGTVVDSFADFGLGFLMFLAGYELDLMRIRGRPLRLAGEGWLLSVVLALAGAVALVSTGFALDSVVVGLALTTTALGTLLPIVRDAGLVDTPFGRHLMAVGTVGEFGPIVAVAMLLTQKDPRLTALLLVTFLAAAVAAALLAARPQPPRLVGLLQKNLHSSSQLPVRVSILLIMLLVYLATVLGLDTLLGAFSAGIVVRLFTRGEDGDVVRLKLEAIGFGFLVPVFFVVSGMHFDLHVFTTRPVVLLRIPLFMALMLVVRGLPALVLYRKVLPAAQRTALAFFSGTGLPLIVVITGIGVSAGRMRPSNAAALVAAGILSVVLFPGLGLRWWKAGGAAGEGSGEAAVGGSGEALGSAAADDGLGSAPAHEVPGGTPSSGGSPEPGTAAPGPAGG